GDYWAASYNRFLGDWSPADPQYNWVFNWDGHNVFWNGRSVGVATTWRPNLSGGIHTQGQVWATSMMLVWDAIGREKTDRIFWEGIAMTGGSANQNDAANAVYQAALALPGCTTADRLAVHTILTDQGYQLPAFEVPVEWLALEAMPREKTVELLWSTATESGNDFYEVEKSMDEGRTFTVIGRVEGAGSSNQVNSYNFTDEQPFAGVNTYRIRQIDTDGQFSYSSLVYANFSGARIGTIAPNPTNGELHIRLSKPAIVPFAVSVLDLQGRALKTIPGIAEGVRFSVADLPKGVYLLRYPDGGEMVSRKFVLR
ncbi:MAG: T9SS type A sorting domain-containing protein, partial [Bacteroidota bacterium]